MVWLGRSFLAVAVLSTALYAIRRDREVRLLVLGIAVLTPSWFAQRFIEESSDN